MSIFPVECCLHSDPSRVYTCVSWQRGRGYRLVGDHNKAMIAQANEFTPLDDDWEAELEATKDGKIIPATPAIDEPVQKVKIDSSKDAAEEDIKEKVRSILEDKSREEIAVIGAKYLGTTVESLLDKYSHLNPGMFRMVIGNRLKKALEC